MVDPQWFVTLNEAQQRLVFRAICKENGWYWPIVAKVFRRRGGPPNRLTPSQRSQQGRKASYSSWARHPNPAERTAKARATFLGKFERTVDPEGKLEPALRKRMATQARKAYFAGLALRSSRRRSSH
jgi:hypothetical protein